MFSLLGILILTPLFAVGYKHARLGSYRQSIQVVSEEQIAAHLKETCGCALYVFAEKIPGVETIFTQQFDKAIHGFETRLTDRLDTALQALFKMNMLNITKGEPDKKTNI